MKRFTLLLLAALVSLSAEAAVRIPTLQYDAEVPQTLRTQIKEDLTFLSTLKGSAATKMHQQVFGKVDGAAYMSWFGDRVNQVGVSPCGSDTAVACVMSAWENKMWFSDNYVNYNQPQIARLSVIYHEARHTEASERFWTHSTCPRPYKDEDGSDMRSIWTGALLAGLPACDVLWNGSYGVQTIFLKNIALKCTNCTEKVKQDADIFAMDQLKRIIYIPTRNLMKQDFGIVVPQAHVQN